MPGIRVAAILLLCAAPAAAQTASQTQFIRALDAMMVSLASESARASATMRREYQAHLSLLMLSGYPDLVGALDNGGLVPIPADAASYNIKPRLDGPHPIGEKDLANQSSYVSARPATIGALLEIASRVKSGPVEVTSLVRHSHYQSSLAATNANANTSVPTHTLGLAFDIGLVNSSLETAYEIRDVLRKMQREGDILFVAERRQLVFHVVPHPSRLGHFTDVYIEKVGLPPTSRSAHVVAASGVPATPRSGRLEPKVIAEVLAILPAHGPAEHWLQEAEDEQAAAAPTAVAAAGMAPAPIDAAAEPGRAMLQRWLVLFAALVTASWRITARSPLRRRLLDPRPDARPQGPPGPTSRSLRQRA